MSNTIPPLPKRASPSKTNAPPPSPFRRIQPEPAPVRMVLNCAEGWGKTTMLSHAPKPLIVMSPQESGFATLRQADRVPDVPCTQPDTWDELLSTLRSATVDEFETICFDALGGVEKLCTDHVLRRDFNGEQSKYQAFGRGNATSASEWMVFLSAIERLAATKDIIIASHVEVSNFNNPDGDNYGRFVSDASKTVWAATKRWADVVLFGTFFTAVDSGKAKGGADRVAYTEHRATFDAKNRYGMPFMLKIPDKPNQIYSSIFSHIKGQ